MTVRSLDRRTVLKAAGVSLALPWLEAMLPRSIAAARNLMATPPIRTAFVYIPNGVNLDTWTPERTGPNYDLKSSLEPLLDLRADVSVISGLDRTFAGGTGVHAQCGSCWLTSSPPNEAKDGGFPTNISLDQMIARQVSRDTLLPSLELSCNDFTDGKETKYFESISWLAPGFAPSVEKNPRAVFDRLFGKPDGDPVTRSVLDAVHADARKLRGRLGSLDRTKLDEYLESVRSTEARIQKSEAIAATRRRPNLKQPAGIPGQRGEYIQLMLDLIVLAFRQDLTRVATLVIDPERWDSPRMYHGVFDTPQNHHVLTHTKGEEAKEKLARIDHFHVEQFAYIVGKLKAIPEGTGTLLDHTALVMGSGLSDGNVHDYRNLPVLLAGKAGGHLKTGEHFHFPGERPLADLWLTLLRIQGLKVDRFADSTGVIKEVLR